MDFKIHRNFPTPELGAAWNDLLRESITDVPFLRYEYLTAWWETRGGGEWPEAEPLPVCASRADRLIGIAPLFAAKNREGLPALMLLGSIEISDYLDLIVRPPDLPQFLGGLLDLLDSDSAPAWSALDWYNLPETSPTLSALRAESDRRGWRYADGIYKPTPVIALPGNWDAYLSGIDKKQRHEIRRKMRRAEEDGRPVRWYFVQDAEQLEAEVDDLLSLMAVGAEKAGFLTGPMRRQMHLTARAAFEAGWLQLAFLEIDGEKACGYLNFDYGNRIWVYNSGLDQRFGELSPGWVLLGHLLQWANENHRVEFDFMRGEEDYKYRFGAQARHVMRVTVTR